MTADGAPVRCDGPPAVAADAPRRRVLVLTSTFPASENDATPDFVLRLCREIGSLFEVVVLAPSIAGRDAPARVGGIRVVRFRYLPRALERLGSEGGIPATLRGNRLWYLAVPFFLLGQLLGIRRLLVRQRFDVIHAHWWLPQGFLAVLAVRLMRRRTPVVCTLHGSDVFAFSGGVMRRLLHWTLRRCARVCAVSEAVADAAGLQRLPPSRRVIAPMGVDLDRFVPMAQRRRSPLSLVFVGRLVPFKGAGWLLDAFAEAHGKIPGLTLDMVGDGPLRAALQARCDRLGVRRAVSFHGALPASAVAERLGAAAIAVAPSVVARDGSREGFGLAAAEAMAAGCALIVSGAHPLAGDIEDGVSGVVVPQQDRSALAAAIQDLVLDRERRERLARAGQRMSCRQYAWWRAGGVYAAVLQGAVSAPQDARGSG